MTTAIIILIIGFVFFIGIFVFYVKAEESELCGTLAALLLAVSIPLISVGFGMIVSISDEKREAQIIEQYTDCDIVKAYVVNVGRNNEQEYHIIVEDKNNNYENIDLVVSHDIYIKYINATVFNPTNKE